MLFLSYGYRVFPMIKRTKIQKKVFVCEFCRQFYCFSFSYAPVPISVSGCFMCMSTRLMRELLRLGNLKREFSVFDDFSLLGNHLVVVQYISGDSQIFVRLWQVELIYFVDFTYLHPSGKFIGVIVNFSGEVSGSIVLVFNVSEYLFDQIFKGDDT